MHALLSSDELGRDVATGWLGLPLDENEVTG